MANNPMLDVTMLLAAQQAYNLSDAGVFNGTPPTGYTFDQPFWNVGTGFKAVTFKNEAAHDYIISFTGTELSSKDLYTDAQLGWNQWRTQDPLAIDGDNVLVYIRAVLADDPAATFHFTGHSLGGGLAEYAAYDAITKLGLADTNLTLTTFNAMGTLDSLARRESTTKDAINAAMGDAYIAHYVAKGDLVGLLGGGHVGEVVNGQLNTYTAGTNTRFFLTAHDKYNPDFQSLAYAQLHDYRPEYLNLDYTQGALAQIASLGDGNGLASSPGATVRLILGFLTTIQVGDRQQLDQLGDWIANNLYQSGLIDANTYTAAIQIDWGIAGNTGNVLSIAGAAALAGVTGTVMDTLTTLQDWAGGAADALINAVRADTVRYTDSVTTELGNTAGRGAADGLSTWQDNGYDFVSILNQADQQATQLLTDPTGFEAQIEANPLSFLPPLTAPVRSDYSSDAPGDTAYNQALTLYNQKATERAQVQSLYDQYVTETNALNLLTTLSARDPADWQTVITGGADNDTLSADPVTTQIYGLTGDDVLSGRTGIDGSVQAIQLYGGPGDDGLYGETFYTGQYYFLGQTDFETQYSRIKPGLGASLYGDAGNDGLQGSLQDDTLDGGLDHDYLVAYLGDDTALGGPGNDLINGVEGQDDIEGNDDNDRLAGGEGADHLQGGTGDDQLYGDARYNFFTWDGSNGTLLYGDLGGSSGNFPVVQDAPESQAGGDVLDGGAGQDELFGGAGDDLLDGGTENDKLQGEGGDDIVFGGDGDDMLWGDSSEDAVTTDAQPIPGDYGTYTYYWRERHVGLDGNDYLDGGAGDDQLWGGGGNDHLVGGLGIDYLQGGLGDSSPSGDDVLEGGDDADYLFGEDGTDTLRGDAGADELLGGDGNDGLFGGTENDKLWGDAGNDVLHGETGDDFLYGGDGEDTLFGGAGIDQIAGDAGRDVIYAGDGDDIIVGDSEDDLIFGELGNDTLDGGSGNDELYGGAGFNTLIGGIGNDIIVGGPGNDIINGGDGDDTLDGGGGTDTVYLSTGNDNYLNIQSDGDYRLALDLATPDNFQITLQDSGGLDRLTFENVFLGSTPQGGSFYLRPSLESLTQEGNDLVIGVYLYSDVNPGTVNIHGTVRIKDQYTAAGRIETIEGLRRKDDIFVTEAAASQVIGDYFTQSSYVPNSATPDFQVLREDAVSIGGIDTVIAVGGPEGGLLPSIFISPYYGYIYYGHEGDDVMIGASRRDYFHGGSGNDRMEGGWDRDSYDINPAEADVVFDDGAGEVSSLDTLIVPNGTLLTDLVFSREGNDLLIGSARIERYFERDLTQTDVSKRHPYVIESLQGSGWSVPDLLGYVHGLGLRFPVTGTSSDDYNLQGNADSEHLMGLAGDDSLYAQAGNDTLDGGAGVDYLVGGDDGDTYLIYAGGGFDFIDESSANPGGSGLPDQTDVVEFGAGITPENIRVEWNSNEMAVDIGGDEGVVMYGDLELFRFADGRELTAAQMQALDQSPAQPGFQEGTDGNDVLLGSFAPDEIYGYAGTDLLIGDAHYDQLYGDIGNDILVGGRGDDFLSGDDGSDVYLFNAGDANAGRADYISDWPVNPNPADIDTLSFGGGIRPEDLEGYLEVIENPDGSGYRGLGVRVSTTGDSLYMDWTYIGTSLVTEDLRIERMQFLDADSLKIFDFAGLVEARSDALRAAFDANPANPSYVPLFTPETLATYDITSATSLAGGQYALNYAFNGDVFDPVIAGTSGNDPTLNGTSGADKIYGFAGNDVLDGGLGDNQLFGGMGDDTYQARLGSEYEAEIYDFISDSGGSDTMVFGPGINPSDIQTTLRVLDPVYYDYLSLSASTIVGGVGYRYDAVITDWGIGNELNPFVGNEIETFVFDSGLQMTAQEIIVQPMSYWFNPETGDYSYGGRTLSGYYFSTQGGSADGVLNGTEGANILRGTATAINGFGGNDSLFGEGGNDVLNGGAGDDKLASEAGDDVLDGGLGADTMFGGSGNDTYLVDDLGDTVTESANEGTDTVQSSITYTLGSNVENLTLTGADTIDGTGNEMANVLTGNGANNILTGGAGGDILDGGDGIDYLHGGDGNDTLNAGSAINYEYLYGEAGNDTLTGSGWLDGGDGDDTLTSTNGYGFLVGGAGADTLYGGASYTYLLGGTGNDTLYAGTGGGYALGGDWGSIDTGDDILVGNAGNDSLTGGDGNDVLSGAAGNDYLYGGTGDDYLAGGEGNDYLYSQAGNDVLYGGAGNDWLGGIVGDDRLIGGAGDDTYSVNSVNDIITEDADEGTDTVLSFGTYALSANLENLTLTGTTAIDGTGNELANILTGNSANNTLYGKAGDDTLLGGAGSDVLHGGSGNDMLNGASGNDALFGGRGDDVLEGKAGNDILTGGEGTDVLKGGKGNDTYQFGFGDGQDTVYENDLTAGNTDTVNAKVNPLDLVFARSGSNLQMSIHGGSGKLTVQSWYYGTAYQTEVFKAADGNQLLNTQVDQLIQAMAQFSANNGGITWDQAIDQNPSEVQAVIAAYWQPAA